MIYFDDLVAKLTGMQFQIYDENWNLRNWVVDATATLLQDLNYSQSLLIKVEATVPSDFPNFETIQHDSSYLRIGYRPPGAQYLQDPFMETDMAFLKAIGITLTAGEPVTLFISAPAFAFSYYG